MGNITIKGNRDGLKVYVNDCSSDEFKNELVKKITNGKDFFAGSKLHIVDEQKKLSSDSYNEIEIFLKNNFNIAVSYNDDTVEKAEKVFSGIYEGKTKFYRSTIRSGQRIIYNGNIVVIGNINSGAEIIASGNIIVLGVLRGVAHAGYSGNRRAIVAAYMLQPSQLRIADIITRSPDERIEKPHIPEVAKIKDDIIIIEPYLLNKLI